MRVRVRVRVRIRVRDRLRVRVRVRVRFRVRSVRVCYWGRNCPCVIKPCAPGSHF